VAWLWAADAYLPAGHHARLLPAGDAVDAALPTMIHANRMWLDKFREALQ
jgi:hypothetical protein